MNITFDPVRTCDVHEMTRWTYDPPYDVYHLSHPPHEAAVAYWLDPTNGVHAIFAAVGGLVGYMVGYCTFGVDEQVPGGNYSADALDLGLARRPDQTGRGLGAVFAECVIDVAQRTYAPPLLRVTIATFNERAQRVRLPSREKCPPYGKGKSDNLLGLKFEIRDLKSPPVATRNLRQ